MTYEMIMPTHQTEIWCWEDKDNTSYIFFEVVITKIIAHFYYCSNNYDAKIFTYRYVANANPLYERFV